MVFFIKLTLLKCHRLAQTIMAMFLNFPLSKSNNFVSYQREATSKDTIHKLVNSSQISKQTNVYFALWAILLCYPQLLFSLVDPLDGFILGEYYLIRVYN